VEQNNHEARPVVAGRLNLRYLNKLKNIARRLCLERIEFKVNISRQEKKNLLTKAKILICTSVREGGTNSTRGSSI